MTTLSARRHYRKQVKHSACRGKIKKSCRKLASCRLTRSGKRKSYCRKRKITNRHSSYKARKNTRANRGKTNMYELLGSSS